METYEIELKKLRIRVDELKRELTVVQDEADAQSNLSRRLQRSNDELEDQVASLKVSVEHMTARARANSGKCRLDGMRASSGLCQSFCRTHNRQCQG